MLCEGGRESWNVRPTFKLLSYFKEKDFLEQNAFDPGIESFGGEDCVREHGALLG